MRDNTAERDPGRNPYFSRRWTEPPRCEGLYNTSALAAEKGVTSIMSTRSMR